MSPSILPPRLALKKTQGFKSQRLTEQRETSFSPITLGTVRPGTEPPTSSEILPPRYAMKKTQSFKSERLSEQQASSLSPITLGTVRPGTEPPTSSEILPPRLALKKTQGFKSERLSEQQESSFSPITLGTVRPGTEPPTSSEEASTALSTNTLAFASSKADTDASEDGGNSPVAVAYPDRASLERTPEISTRMLRKRKEASDTAAPINADGPSSKKRRRVSYRQNAVPSGCSEAAMRRRAKKGGYRIIWLRPVKF